MLVHRIYFYFSYFIDLFLLVISVRVKPRKKKMLWLFKSTILLFRYSHNAKPRKIPISYLESDIWNQMNKMLRLSLKYLTLPGIIRSPVLETVTSPHLFKYKIDLELESNINRITAAQIYSSIFDIEEKDFYNGLNYYLVILCKLFDRTNFKNLDGYNILEIGPGLGILDLFFHLEGAKLYSFETEEMRFLQNLISKEIKMFEASSKFIFNDHSSVKEPFGVVSFFAFTEMDLITRKDLMSIIARADWVVIVSNYSFEDINNFDYLENIFSEKFELVTRFKIEQLGILDMPNYAKQHEAFLFHKKII
jgi:hypothetical protein